MENATDLVSLIIECSGAFMDVLERRADTTTRYRCQHLALHHAIRVGDRQHIEEILFEDTYFSGAFERVILCLTVDHEIKMHILETYVRVLDE